MGDGNRSQVRGDSPENASEIAEQGRLQAPEKVCSCWNEACKGAAVNDSVDGMWAEGLGLAHQSLLGAMPKKAGLLGTGKETRKDFKVRTNVAGFVSCSGNILCPCLCSRLYTLCKSTGNLHKCVSL